MPRKNARPAAKKAAARKKARMTANANPQRHIGLIAHAPVCMAMHGALIAALAGSAVRSFDMGRDPEIDRIIEDSLDDPYES
jgi:hypothetical protein